MVGVNTEGVDMNENEITKKDAQAIKLSIEAAKDKRIAELDLHSNGLQIKVSQLLKLNENLHKISTETGQRIKELEAQVERMRGALEGAIEDIIWMSGS